MAPYRVGKSIYEVLEVEKGNRPEVIIKPEIDEVLTEGCCDVCLVATDTFTKKVFPKIKTVLEKKINVVTTAEKMACPQAQNPELAAEIDKIAKENGVSVLGTGINPGLKAMIDLPVPRAIMGDFRDLVKAID